MWQGQASHVPTCPLCRSAALGSHLLLEQSAGHSLYVRQRHIRPAKVCQDDAECCVDKSTPVHDVCEGVKSSLLEAKAACQLQTNGAI